MKKIQQQQPAPDFTAYTIGGQQIQLSNLKGKKVLLNFHRNVGCPICNLRFHTLEQQAAYFKEHNLEVINVYESSPERMKSYLEGVEVQSLMIPDPQQALYRLYGVERSYLKVLKGIFKGGLRKIREGKALAKHNLKQDGNMDRVGAEFLIDEKGRVIIAHYSDFLGDHIPVDKIHQLIG